MTLKQALPNAEGGLVMITREECVRTAKILRDRLIKRLLGSCRYKKGERLPFAVFVEGDGDVTRYHLHILAQVPFGVLKPDLRSLVQRHWQKLDWVHQEIDLKFISADPQFGALRIAYYSLGEGLGAFCPEASCLPTVKAELA